MSVTAPKGFEAAGVAVGLYAVSFQHGFGLAWSSAFAALLLGLVGYPVARRARIPTLVVVATGITPLLPGLSIYRGLALLTTSASASLLALFNAAAIAIALSSGAILGEYFAQPIRREAHRLEARLAGPRPRARHRRDQVHRPSAAFDQEGRIRRRLQTRDPRPARSRSRRRLA